MLRRIRHRFGSHVSIEKGDILNTFKSNPGLLCLQVYFGNKITYQVRKIAKADKEEIRNYLTAFNKTLYIHSPVVANLSKVDEEDEIHIKSMSVISSLLKSVRTLPIGIVLHIGAKGELSKVIEHVNQLIEEGTLTKGVGLVKNHLLLEVSAGSGSQLGCTWEEVEELSANLDSKYVGLCLDTAHMFGAGMCSFSSEAEIDQMFERIDKLSMKVGLIHINDSKVPFQSYKDRHEVLGQGYIWGSDETRPMLDYFLSICFKRRIDVISETPDVDADIKLMRELSNAL
jgi:deoxyribonuclease-4